MRRTRLLPYLPPVLLVIVAGVQFAVAQTTSLTPWKLGGFGMFSTSDYGGFRTLHVRIRTDGGTFVVPRPAETARVLSWPRQAVLRDIAREAVCKPWRFVPIDSSESVVFPSPEWDAFYSAPSAREQTTAAGFAVPADTANLDAHTVRAAQVSVVWHRLDSVGNPSRVVPQGIASVAVTPAEAGCAP